MAQFTVEAGELGRLLTIVGEPKLELVRFDLSSGGMTITARPSLSDMILSVDAQLVVPDQDGSVVLPYVALRSLAQAQVGRQLTFTSRDGTVEWSCGQANGVLRTGSTEDFPPFSRERLKGPAIVIDAKALRPAITRVATAIPPKTSALPALEGVYIDVDPVTLVACDGQRLHFQELEAEVEGDPQPIIVPEELMSAIARRLPSEGAVRLAPNRGFAATWPGFRIAGRAIAGPYPPYRALFPPTFQRQMTFDRLALLTACRCAAAIAIGDCRFKFSFEGDVLSIEVQQEGVGSTTERVGCISTSDTGPVQWAARSRNFMDGLRDLEASTVTIELNAPDKVFKLSSTDALQVYVMPLVLPRAQQADD